MPMTREQLAQLLMQSKRSPEQMAGGVPQNAPFPTLAGDTGGSRGTFAGPAGTSGSPYPTPGGVAGPAGTTGSPYPEPGPMAGPAGTTGAPFNDVTSGPPDPNQFSQPTPLTGAPDDPTQSGITPELLNDPGFLEYFRRMTGKDVPGSGRPMQGPPR